MFCESEFPDLNESSSATNVTDADETRLASGLLSLPPSIESLPLTLVDPPTAVIASEKWRN